MKKVLFFFVFVQFFSLLSDGSLIILYGTSSAGKTSIGRALTKIMPGKWKFIGIDMFKNTDGTANDQMWAQAAKDLDAGYSVVIDTVFSRFLIQQRFKDIKPFVVLTYCSPTALTQHVEKRNNGENEREYRKLFKVLKQYCHKYIPVRKDQKHIDVLRLSDLENNPYSRQLKKIKQHYFNDDPVIYVASRLCSYDCFINTGTKSIAGCCQQIKKEFEEKFAEI